MDWLNAQLNPNLHCFVYVSYMYRVLTWIFPSIKSRSPSQKVGVPFPPKSSPISSLGLIVFQLNSVPHPTPKRFLLSVLSNHECYGCQVKHILIKTN